MESSGINEIKNELRELSAKDLSDLCLALARYKKDNKEYLGYLLFKAHHKRDFANEVRQELDEQFGSITDQTNLYYAKKSLRKILRQVNKYTRYLSDGALSAELYIYYLSKLKNSGIPFQKSKLIVNLYEQQLKKIRKLISELHEDLQADYSKDLEELI